MSPSIHAPPVPVMGIVMDFNPLFINFCTKHKARKCLVLR